MRALSLAALALFAAATHAEDKSPKFYPLFDGKTLNGWTAVAKPGKDGKAGDPKETWSVVDGTIRSSGVPNGYLRTNNGYSNYVLRLKWRFPIDGPAKRNSGVLLHVQEPDTYWPHSVEAQMLNGSAGDVYLNPDADKKLPTVGIDPARFDTDDPNKRHYFRMKTDKPVEKPLGEWNEYEIVSKGGALTLTVNGVKVNEAASGSLKKGRIALQSEGAEVFFKDVEIGLWLD